MRSVFPALHDRLLSTVLLGAVLLFLATLVAVSLGESGADAKEASEGPPLWMTGATPPTN